MAVPNTNTFSLQDVVNEIKPTTNDLKSCVTSANNSLYDSNYYTEPATSLLEFRNYGHSSVPPGTVRTVLFIAAIHNLLPNQYSNVNALIGTTVNGYDANLNQGGALNMADIINQTGHTDSAARDCQNYDHQGYSDWILGTTTELNFLLNQKTIIDNVSLANGGDVINTGYYFSSTEESDTRAYASNGSVITNLLKSQNANIRPQKTLFLSPSSDYSVGDYAFGGVIFQIYQLQY